MTSEELQVLARELGTVINESELNNRLDPHKTGIVIICVDRSSGHVGWVGSLTKQDTLVVLSSIIAREAN